MIPEAVKLSHSIHKELRVVLAEIYSYLVTDERCAPDVKTIYISFTLNGEMVAAIYPSNSVLDIAVALPEIIHPLYWKTLRILLGEHCHLCLDSGDADMLEPAMELIAEAVSRVRERFTTLTVHQSSLLQDQKKIEGDIESIRTRVF